MRVCVCVCVCVCSEARDKQGGGVGGGEGGGANIFRKSFLKCLPAEAGLKHTNFHITKYVLNQYSAIC